MSRGKRAVYGPPSVRRNRLFGVSMDSVVAFFVAFVVAAMGRFIGEDGFE